MASVETTQESKAVTAQAQKGAGRGPSYPALSIKEAIDKLRSFYTAERRNAAPLAAAARHWGYSSTSSSGRVTAAALIQYGLLDDDGSRDSRTLKVTGRALDILLDADDSPKRLEAIQDAVRAPKANAEVFARHAPHELPSDATLRYFLLREKGFNDGAVDNYIKNLRESIAYAKLDKPGTIPNSEKGGDGEKPGVPPPDVGDLIQWESSGVLRMEAPRKVRAKQEHDGAWWVFVEGSETGIPMEEVKVVERVQREEAKKSPPTLPVVADFQANYKIEGAMRRDTFSLDEGRVVLEWPEKMSAAGFEDFESWVQLQLRKIKRSIAQS